MPLFFASHTLESNTLTQEAAAEGTRGWRENAQKRGITWKATVANTEQGKAWCLNEAPSQEALSQAFDDLGFPYDEITEVWSLTEKDLD